MPRLTICAQSPWLAHHACLPRLPTAQTLPLPCPPLPSLSPHPLCVCRICVVFRSVGRVSSRGVARMMTPPSVAEQKVVQTDVPMYNEDPEAVARGQMRPRAVDLTWDKVCLPFVERVMFSRRKTEVLICHPRKESITDACARFVSPDNVHREPHVFHRSHFVSCLSLV